ncbi:penicillin-binding protein PBP1A [Streptococcus saliviloxodontae]|uniref:Penicillin-binding protein 1A n=1 Tax=Streptococcus saliviloxodontae TaxID=1349416 RepID=A0ABS2PMY5_9STRE|nr:penicillin-binding protein PBP1A [Streptococcus saliviloxodontae]MBM7636799.1 penicillin-binding protein 1A [Streptococcus saliviloxodontae]
MKTVSRVLKYSLITILSLAIIGVISGGLLFAYYVSSTPQLSKSKLESTNSSLIYDNSGNLIADLGSEKRESVSADSIPVNLVNAVTSIEDKRFFKHRGVDVYRIMGAAWNNIISSSTQGGSTLDQQLIKLAYYSTNESDQTFKRKAQEVWLALQMEQQYTKEEILTFYINKVYMGNGYYGMQTAAKAYYGKELKDLSVAQVALLAGIPQAPTQYDPYNNPDAAKARRDIVLGEMLEDKKITNDEYKTALATPISDGLQTLEETSSYEPYLDNYIKQVIEQVKTKTGQDVFTAGLKVYTNVDQSAQQQLWDIYNSGLYVSYPDEDFQVASTVVDVTNGKVIAQLGSRNQDSNVSLGTNQAVQTDRDFGSTMKPITDYAPAIENGIYTSTGDTVKDTPYNYPGTSTPVYDWDRQYYGSISLTYALQQSRNIPAVRALEAVGLDTSLGFLNKLGINYPEMYYSNAISSSTSKSGQEYGASSEKMAAAYAAFANGGTYNEPMYINKIEFSDGTSKEYNATSVKAMSETTAYMMTDMLKTVLTSGTGTYAAVSGAPYNAGKTGTSNYSDSELEQIEESTGIYSSSVGTMAPDESFVGYTTQYAMAVWTGYSNRMTPIYGDNLNIAAEVYSQMSSYLNTMYGSGSTNWEMPDGAYRSGGYVYLGNAPKYSYSYRNSDSDSSSSSTTTTTEEETSESTTTSQESSSSEESSSETSADSSVQSESSAA